MCKYWNPDFISLHYKRVAPGMVVELIKGKCKTFHAGDSGPIELALGTQNI